MVSAPIDAGGGQTIYSRGRYIIDAIFGTLAARHGLAAATDYVVNGNSAGGLATYLHADYVADLIHAVSPAAKVVAVPDSGFFMDVPDFNGNRGLWSSFAATFSFHNATGPGSLNPACLAAKSAGDWWMCAMVSCPPSSALPKRNPTLPSPHTSLPLSLRRPPPHPNHRRNKFIAVSSRRPTRCPSSARRSSSRRASPTRGRAAL